MFHVIYTSREKQEFTVSALKNLLMRARIKNGSANVTGMLIYHAGVFLQALEGEEAAARAIFAQIEKDPRHEDIRVLCRNTSVGKRRLFGDWAMGYADATGVANILRGYIEFKRDLDLSALGEVEALEILKTSGQDPQQLTA